jgi:hypothetical protein
MPSDSRPERKGGARKFGDNGVRSSQPSGEPVEEWTPVLPWFGKLTTGVENLSASATLVLSLSKDGDELCIAAVLQTHH